MGYPHLALLSRVRIFWCDVVDTSIGGESVFKWSYLFSVSQKRFSGSSSKLGALSHFLSSRLEVARQKKFSPRLLRLVSNVYTLWLCNSLGAI